MASVNTTKVLDCKGLTAKEIQKELYKATKTKESMEKLEIVSISSLSNDVLVLLIKITIVRW